MPASNVMTPFVQQDEVLYTFKEAMNYLRVSRSTVYRLMWTGQITGSKIGSTWRFERETLRALIDRGKGVSLARNTLN